MAIENSDKDSRLKELSDSAFEISEGQDDIRNWRVSDEQGKKIGKVADLLFDTQSDKVRYIILDLEDNELNLDRRKVLIPIGIARLHAEDDDVVLPGVAASQLNTLPDYIKGEVNPGVENLVRYALAEGNREGTGLTGHSLTNEELDFYSHHHFDEDAFYKSRGNKEVIIQIVIGLFDDSMEAESALRELVVYGFSQDRIDLSSSNLTETALNPQDASELTTGISNFINTSTSDVDERETARGGSVLTVQCVSQEEAKMATVILDKSGAVQISESS